jgi:ferredoxin, 2Fe-2S
MVWITYISAAGEHSRVEGRVGSNLMLAAVQNNVRGIDGECGGCLSCATCHVYLDPEWQERFPAADPAERRATSRLACQLVLTPQCDGLRVFMPETQS